jgi:putative ABC transport system substrate-binding protein
MSSNSKVDRYQSVENSFKETFKHQYKYIDISNMSKNEIKDYLYDECPDVVYTIGAKAYQYANTFIPEKTILFSSIVNYKRFYSKGNKSGVSNELHSGMQLTLINTIFDKQKKLGIFYSKFTKDIFEDYKQQAKKLGMDIRGFELSNEIIDQNFFQECDAVILIADPMLIKSEKRIKYIFDTMKNLKKPVFAYNDLFIKYGASMVISADNPTIGRQIASMIEIYQQKNILKDVQFPMGTNIVLNKKLLDELDINYNKSALSVVNKIIE